MNYAQPPRALFEGVNFMTPSIEGYVKVRGEGYAEISTGRGMENEKIFGVTVRPRDVAESKLFGSRREAIEYIESIRA